MVPMQVRVLELLYQETISGIPPPFRSMPTEIPGGKHVPQGATIFGGVQALQRIIQGPPDTGFFCPIFRGNTMLIQELPYHHQKNPWIVVHRGTRSILMEPTHLSS